MFLKRISVLLCPFLVFLGLELLFYNIKLIYISLVVLTLILLFFLKFLIKEKFFSQDFFYLAFLPFLLFYLTISLLFLVGSDTLRHIIIIIFVLILILYLENIFLFFHRPLHYQAYSLENLSTFLNLLIFFLLVIDLNALNIFLNLSICLLSLILFLIFSLLLFHSFWINKIRTNL